MDRVYNTVSAENGRNDKRDRNEANKSKKTNVFRPDSKPEAETSFIHGKLNDGESEVNNMSSFRKKKKLLKLDGRKALRKYYSLEGQNFFICIKKITVVSEANVAQTVKELGGKVANFLSRDVTCVLTDIDSSEKSGDFSVMHCQCDSSPIANINTNSSPLGVNRQITHPISRGQSILLKAKSQVNYNPKCNKCGNYNNGLQHALALGIKIWNLKDFFSWVDNGVKAQQLNKLNKNQNARTIKNSEPKLLGNPSIKVESCGRKHKPFYKVFSSEPTIFVEPSYKGSPFESPSDQSFREKPMLLNHNGEDKTEVTSSAVLKKMTSFFKVVKENKIVQKDKRQFCECCKSWFYNLQQHLFSKKHKEFISNHTNFIFLKEIVDTFPDILHFSEDSNETQFQSFEATRSIRHSLSDSETFHRNNDCEPQKKKNFIQTDNPEEIDKTGHVEDVLEQDICGERCKPETINIDKNAADGELKNCIFNNEVNDSIFENEISQISNIGTENKYEGVKITKKEDSDVEANGILDIESLLEPLDMDLQLSIPPSEFFDTDFQNGNETTKHLMFDDNNEVILNLLEDSNHILETDNFSVTKRNCMQLEEQRNFEDNVTNTGYVDNIQSTGHLLMQPTSGSYPSKEHLALSELTCQSLKVFNHHNITDMCDVDINFSSNNSEGEFSLNISNLINRINYEVQDETKVYSNVFPPVKPTENNPDMWNELSPEKFSAKEDFRECPTKITNLAVNNGIERIFKDTVEFEDKVKDMKGNTYIQIAQRDENINRCLEREKTSLEHLQNDITDNATNFVQRVNQPNFSPSREFNSNQHDNHTGLVINGSVNTVQQNNQLSLLSTVNSGPQDSLSLCLPDKGSDIKQNNELHLSNREADCFKQNSQSYLSFNKTSDSVKENNQLCVLSNGETDVIWQNTQTRLSFNRDSITDTVIQSNQSKLLSYTELDNDYPNKNINSFDIKTGNVQQINKISSAENGSTQKNNRLSDKELDNTEQNNQPGIGIGHQNSYLSNKELDNTEQNNQPGIGIVHQNRYLFSRGEDQLFNREAVDGHSNNHLFSNEIDSDKKINQLFMGNTDNPQQNSQSCLLPSNNTDDINLNNQTGALSDSLVVNIQHNYLNPFISSTHFGQTNSELGLSQTNTSSDNKYYKNKWSVNVKSSDTLHLVFTTSQKRNLQDIISEDMAITDFLDKNNTNSDLIEEKWDPSSDTNSYLSSSSSDNESTSEWCVQHVKDTKLKLCKTKNLLEDRSLSVPKKRRKYICYY
ncbi:uncharacterized protein LOC106464036 isoform X2 [Limulus polyphemus]|uniref:Uncharacterized protein LOC106464036 isoform X2 n=1 Tax=Limulus polyphemus TaxID=6850 RepID=A0ABM1SUU9_LIMPO|nr:uncharacterized protein LOC106464036 isoform X2 [Limulus polyphemus]